MKFPFVKGKICRLDKFKKLPKATPLLFQSDSVEIHFIYCSHPFDDFPTETTTAPTTNMYSCVRVFVKTRAKTLIDGIMLDDSDVK